MAENSLPWSGISVGDAGPYSDDNWSDMYRKLFQYDRTKQGPLFGYANELAVTNPAGTTIHVATGAALVDGKFYENTANVDLSAAGGDGFYTVVLRKDFAAQTVRLAILGPAGITPPVTQTDGTIWEIMLATVSVLIGVPTVYDIREFCMYSNPLVRARQGGSATIWNTVGATKYNAKGAIVQCGVAHHTAAGVDTIVFPIEFSDTPIVIATCNNSLAHIATAEAVTYQGFQLYIYTNAGVDVTADANWIAIGPV